MKTFVKFMVMALVVGLVFYGLDAFAETNHQNVFKYAADTLTTTFKNVRMIVYVLGAFGLIGIAVGGILGKVSFKWLAMLAFGLAIVAAADGIIRYATKGKDYNDSESQGIGYSEYELGK